MKRLQLIIIFIYYTLTTIGQEAGPGRTELIFGSGISKLLSTDQLLNYYNYKSDICIPFSLKYSFSINKNLLIIESDYLRSKSYPVNIKNTYYKYNYIKNQQIGLSIAYFRNVSRFHKLQVFAGLSYTVNYIGQSEYFDNILYDFGEGAKKSYDLSIFNLSPTMSVKYSIERSTLCAQIRYSPFTLSARPDDNFVKQMGQGKYCLIFYTPANYLGFLYSLAYHFRIKEKFGVFAEYVFQYSSYNADRDHKYSQNMLLTGISKSF